MLNLLPPSLFLFFSLTKFFQEFSVSKNWEDGSPLLSLLVVGGKGDEAGGKKRDMG